ncbi:hypothetical protein CY34DRAFT_773558 [Suillus luteus UH-Slu-Lm8-n1]|uniref:Uncharacterized protein n=1 Tax=Suillus luteus UH-Slu-Lm8-n1 TaxID=930992 RepID=A0A0D0AIX8_9AGAM|nr:hypothetical protein CY34DRAFT_773558 [Suillus luteus UH-Slu-Lm8-n1]
MVKNPRKREKTGKNQHEKGPLGAQTHLHDGASKGKDDEERRLKHLFFGVPYVREKAGMETPIVSDEKADDGQLEVRQELENLLDSDFFTSPVALFVDDNVGPSEPSQVSQESDAEELRRCRGARNAGRSRKR